MVTKTNLTLVKKPCNKTTCPEHGQVHAKCRAHNRRGLPCLRNPLRGQNVCDMHGGKTPSHLAVGKQRVALAEMNSMSSRIAGYDDAFDESPAEGLLREVAWSAQVAMALGEIVATGSDDALVHSGPQGAQFNVFVTMWERERMNHARLCKLALECGIAQRQLDIIETQAGQIVAAMISLLTNPRLGLSSEQIIEG